MNLFDMIKAVLDKAEKILKKFMGVEESVTHLSKQVSTNTNNLVHNGQLLTQILRRLDSIEGKMGGNISYQPYEQELEAQMMREAINKEMASEWMTGVSGGSDPLSILSEIEKTPAVKRHLGKGASITVNAFPVEKSLYNYHHTEICSELQERYGIIVGAHVCKKIVDEAGVPSAVDHVNRYDWKFYDNTSGKTWELVPFVANVIKMAGVPIKFSSEEDQCITREITINGETFRFERKELKKGS